MERHTDVTMRDPNGQLAVTFIAATVALCLMGGQVAAQGKPGKPSDAPRLDFSVPLVSPEAVKVDGFVTDWEGMPAVEAVTLTRGEHEYDWTGPKDLSMTVQAQYDKKYLFLAVTVKDNLVTYKKGRKAGDRVEVWIDAGELAKRSRAGRLRMLELAPGEMKDGGKPEVTWAYPRSLKGEPEGLLKDGAIRVDGYFFELAIPLSALGDPPPGLEPLGLTFIARDWDYDDPAEDEAAVATSPFDGKKKRDVDTLGKLVLADAEAVKKGIYKLVPGVMGKPVVGATFADVGGDLRREWVQVVGSYLSISGYGLGDGEYYYFGMPKTATTKFLKMETRDLTGDGKDEMVVTYTIDYTTPKGAVTQELVAVYQFALDRIKLVFQHEVANRGPGWSIENDLKFKPGRRGKPTDIIVSRGRVEGDVTQASYVDADQDLIVDWGRMLLPWEEEKARKFTWEISQFIKN